MAAYYQTKIVYKWYQKAKSTRDLNTPQYTILDKDKLTDCQETICSVKELGKWLVRRKLPPDGYSVPFDGVHDEALTTAMFEEICRYRNAKRCYTALKAGCTYDALHEAACCFLPAESREEQLRRYVRAGVPDYLAELMNYADEAVELLLGVCPQNTNALAAAAVLCDMWKDIERWHDAELQKKYGLNIRDYGKGTAGVMHWWANPAAYDEIQQLLDERRNHIIKSLYYYRRKCAEEEQDPEIQRLTRFPGSWENAISRIERIRVGPQWKSAEDVLDYVLVSPAACIKSGMDDIVNMHLNRVHFQIDSDTNQQYLIADSIVDAMYAYLSFDLQHGLDYRKCLCCDTYFVVGSHDRKYCDAHMPPNGQYQRRMINKRLEETAQEKELKPQNR